MLMMVTLHVLRIAVVVCKMSQSIGDFEGYRTQTLL